MQRAAISCPTNIAEGSAKSGFKYFARFLEIAHGSLLELETELMVAMNLGYIDVEKYTLFLNKIIELQKMIYSFKDRLYQQDER